MMCCVLNNRKIMHLHLNIPNILTISRLAFIPVIIVFFYLPYDWARPAAAWLYGLACITDWFDGYLARKLDQQSAMGAFLDPVADKLIVAVALILIASEANAYHWIVVLSTTLIIGREITISALREWMATIGHRSAVAVNMTGKMKTAVQMLAIGFLLHKVPFYGLDTRTTGVVLVVIAAAFTLVSMVQYLKAAWDEVKSSA